MEHPGDSSEPLPEIKMHYLVAQATGVLLEQFKLTPDAAFERLTAEAADRGRPVVDVAGEIVENGGL